MTNETTETETTTDKASPTQFELLCIEQLTVGMLTDKGLITYLDVKGGDPFWEGKPNIGYFDLNDGYYGTCYRELKPDESFKILHHWGSAKYKEIVNRIRNERIGYREQCQKDIDLLNKYLLDT